MFNTEIVTVVIPEKYRWFTKGDKELAKGLSAFGYTKIWRVPGSKNCQAVKEADADMGDTDTEPLDLPEEAFQSVRGLAQKIDKIIKWGDEE